MEIVLGIAALALIYAIGWGWQTLQDKISDKASADRAKRLGQDHVPDDGS